MNWEAIGAIGEIIGAAAVVASLIYLARQMRQNSENVRSQGLNTKASQTQQLFDLQTRPEVLKVLKIAYTQPDVELSFEEACVMESYIGTALSVIYNAFKHHQLGMDSDWEMYQTWIQTFLSPKYSQTWWKTWGHKYWTKEFALEIDRIVAQLESDTSGDYWVNYESHNLVNRANQA